MPEGPTLVILKEELLPLVGQKVIDVDGYADIDRSLILNKKIVDIRTWGKLLLIVLPKITVRIHFLLFGSYMINERKKKTNPRLRLVLKNETELNFYMCSVKLMDERIEDAFDWQSDVMNDAWDEEAALRKLSELPDALIADALLDQNIFSGVGNVIKNELLYRVGIHPMSEVRAIRKYKLLQIIREARQYSFEFLQWKKEGVLKMHWCVHRKDKCPKHDIPLKIKVLGKAKRKAYYCEKCQTLYL